MSQKNEAQVSYHRQPVSSCVGSPRGSENTNIPEPYITIARILHETGALEFYQAAEFHAGSKAQDVVQASATSW